jgi:cephalosporin hydroxylase
MFDFADFYEEVASTVPDGTTLVEVGLGEGTSVICLAESLLNAHKEGCHVIGVDNLAYGGSAQLNALVRHVVQAQVAPYVELRVAESLVASCAFPDESLEFVFLDSGHQYEQTKAEIRCWLPKVRCGGVLAGHDYFSTENPGVRQAVEELIPSVWTRTDIPDREFPPEPILETRPTGAGYGVWMYRKRFYVRI